MAKPAKTESKPKKKPAKEGTKPKTKTSTATKVKAATKTRKPSPLKGRKLTAAHKAAISEGMRAYHAKAGHKPGKPGKSKATPTLKPRITISGKLKDTINKARANLAKLGGIAKKGLRFGR